MGVPVDHDIRDGGLPAGEQRAEHVKEQGQMVGQRA